MKAELEPSLCRTIRFSIILWKIKHHIANQFGSAKGAAVMYCPLSIPPGARSLRFLQGAGGSTFASSSRRSSTDRESMPAWRPRFYDFNVWTERKRLEKLRYMHRNPVKRGLLQEPKQWRWSSFRYYMYGEEEAVRVNDCDLMRMSGGKPAV